MTTMQRTPKSYDVAVIGAGQAGLAIGYFLARQGKSFLILEAQEIERVRSLLEELLARDTGKTPEQVREDTERDLVLTAEQALAYGVVDAVITARDAGVVGPAQAARQTGEPPG